jgi:cytosine/uracil/thiamine/allantoin permease
VQNAANRATIPVAMKWFHLIFGVLLFIGFTVTGKFMRVDFPDKEAISQELRLLMRSRHIYILFSALIHLALGVYLQTRPGTARKLLQYSGSAVLFASSVLLVWAFVVETYSLQQFSDISRNGIYTSLAGVILHVLGGTSWNRER